MQPLLPVSGAAALADQPHARYAALAGQLHARYAALAESPEDTDTQGQSIGL